MAAPGIPQNFYAQTANSQNYVSWDLVAGATSYDVQRSTDGVTYASVSTPTNPEYLDSSVTVGSQYWYKVAAVNSDGTGPYTTAQSVVPTKVGEMSLGQIRLLAQQRADRVNSNFVTKPEWNQYINQSLFELFDILVTQYGEDYFVAAPAQFTTNGTDQFYPLPDGSRSFVNALTQQSYVAPAIYKLIGVDLGLNSQQANLNNGWVTINRFNFAADRNKFFYPNTASTLYGVFNLLYRQMGDNIQFIPAPSANQPVRLWYIPRMTMLLKDTDITTSSVSGWVEYVIVDAAIKALQKEESDISALMIQKQALLTRIEGAAANRDTGRPDTIADTRATRGWGGWENGPGNGFGGGY